MSIEVDLASLQPESAEAWGFRSGNKGTHTSRTMMLAELDQLMSTVPDAVDRATYAVAVMDHNCLGKRTAATRKLTFQRLTELYALDHQVLLFAVLRELWQAKASRPLLALLMALTRDPLLRITAGSVLDTPVGNEFSRQTMKDSLASHVGERLSDATIDKVVRNASSSWTQSGHLRGSGRKYRQRMVATPTATAYALMIAYASGRRGRRLFESPWMAPLDAELPELLDLAVEAKRLGILEIKQSAQIIEVTFPMLLRLEAEKGHGTYRQAG